MWTGIKNFLSGKSSREVAKGRLHLVLAHDRVRARRIDQAEIAQPRHRHATLEQRLAHISLVRLVAVPNDLDDLGRRRRAHREHVLAEQGVQHGGLAGIELAQHDEPEEVRQVAIRLLQDGAIVAAQVEPVHRREQVAHDRPDLVDLRQVRPRRRCSQNVHEPSIQQKACRRGTVTRG